MRNIWWWSMIYIENDMQGPCPSGFHIPAQSEAQLLGTYLSSILGRTPTGQDLIDYFLMPASGMLPYTTGSLSYVWDYIKTRTVDYYSSGTYVNGYNFWATSTSGNISSTAYNRRWSGYAIRPIKNDAVIPDRTSWEPLYEGEETTWGDVWPGIYHNSELWLISISWDWENWITIADKNLWATSTDTGSTDSYWYYYQWWNNYWFPGSWFTTSSTRVNASNYWPGNYYNNSVFITTSSNNDWSTIRNDNLWWWVTKQKDYYKRA